MFRLTISIFAALVVLSMSATAFAQNSQERTQFFDFENHVIDGKFVTPEMWQGSAGDRAHFDDIFQLETPDLRAKIRENGAGL